MPSTMDNVSHSANPLQHKASLVGNIECFFCHKELFVEFCFSQYQTPLNYWNMSIVVVLPHMLALVSILFFHSASFAIDLSNAVNSDGFENDTSRPCWRIQ